jgi:uncharacterized protein with PIN domain
MKQTKLLFPSSQKENCDNLSEDGKEKLIQISLRFYEELNDFLLPEKRKKEFYQKFNCSDTIKHVVSSFGIADYLVDLVLVNGQPVPFSYLINDGDRISIYPKFESFDISKVTKLRQKPLRTLRFIADVHVGKLARYLRMLGFDTLYENDYDDSRIVAISLETDRIILTRDRGLLTSKEATRGYLVKNIDLKEQIREVISRFDLLTLINPFSLCLSCNSKVRKIDRKDVQEKIDPGIYEQFDEFSSCPDCKKIFWQGSHYRSMSNFIEQIKK